MNSGLQGTLPVTGLRRSLSPPMELYDPGARGTYADAARRALGTNTASVGRDSVAPAGDFTIGDFTARDSAALVSDDEFPSPSMLSRQSSRVPEGSSRPKPRPKPRKKQAATTKVKQEPNDNTSVPVEKSSGHKGRRVGASGYSDAEKLILAEAVASVLPTGPVEWDEVHALFNERCSTEGYPQREKTSLRTKWNSVSNIICILIKQLY
jgi:hypothetical protein